MNKDTQLGASSPADAPISASTISSSPTVPRHHASHQVADLVAIPGWVMRCGYCMQRRIDGIIDHRRNCSEWRPPRSPLAPKMRPHQIGATPSARERYERFVSLLGPEGRPGRYQCPSCGAPADGHGLKIDFDGVRIQFICFACRGTNEILAALHITWQWLTGEDTP